MGAVRTAGRGSELEASPEVERTLTVGRLAIVLRGLEDSLDVMRLGDKL